MWRKVPNLKAAGCPLTSWTAAQEMVLREQDMLNDALRPLPALALALWRLMFLTALLPLGPLSVALVMLEVEGMLTLLLELLMMQALGPLLVLSRTLM